MIFSSFVETLDKLGRAEYHDFWIEDVSEDSAVNNLLCDSLSCGKELSEIICSINRQDMENWSKLRKRMLKNAPVLKGTGTLVDTPALIEEKSISIDVSAIVVNITVTPTSDKYGLLIYGITC